MILLLPEDLIDEKNYDEVYKLLDSACIGINIHYTDENGKEATNKVKYVRTHFFKSSYAKVEVKYKLISTLTGEVILQGNKIVDNEEYTYWDTYDVVSGTLKDKSQFYRNDREENLSNKEKFFRETAVKILKEINLELKKLPDYDIWKLYIS